MSYEFHALKNGIRLIHKREQSPVAYCGIAINTGTRDEQDDEHGLAHLTEHLLFKGTKKRRARHIINRLEDVGGELNAYTNKEETVIYAVSLKEDFARAAELISDMVFHSVFPEQEIEKEIEVVLDEIRSYEDSPSDLIYDDFENLIFAHNPIGRNILGQTDLLKQMQRNNIVRFVGNNYHTDQMVFFSLGDFDFRRIIQMMEKYLGDIPSHTGREKRQIPSIYIPENKIIMRNTNQAHLMLGGRACSLHDKQRISLHLLNNILGGPGMNSLLNMSLREQHGLVYDADSNYTAYSDTGIWSIYAGTDFDDTERCISLINKELKKLREKVFSDIRLAKYKKQFMGQLAIASQNKESTALNMGKRILHFGQIETMQEVWKQIEKITAKDIQNIACELFDEKQLSLLIYQQ